jgi:hypothetical protein
MSHKSYRLVLEFLICNILDESILSSRVPFLENFYEGHHLKIVPSQVRLTVKFL